jgi:hypothetical protein
LDSTWLWAHGRICICTYGRLRLTLSLPPPPPPTTPAIRNTGIRTAEYGCTSLSGAGMGSARCRIYRVMWPEIDNPDPVGELKHTTADMQFTPGLEAPRVGPVGPVECYVIPVTCKKRRYPRDRQTPPEKGVRPRGEQKLKDQKENKWCRSLVSPTYRV